jgi:hypothetical protein
MHAFLNKKRRRKMNHRVCSDDIAIFSFLYVWCCPGEKKRTRPRRKKNIHNMTGIESEHDLLNLIILARFWQVKPLIIESPKLLWAKLGSQQNTIAHEASFHSDIDMLDYMYQMLLKLYLVNGMSKQEFRHKLMDTFESPDVCREIPVHKIARVGSVDCIVFLIEHCPSGTGILEVRDASLCSAAHESAWSGVKDKIDFVVRNSPSGIERAVMAEDKFGRIVSSYRNCIPKYRHYSISSPSSSSSIPAIHQPGSFVAFTSASPP